VYRMERLVGFSGGVQLCAVVEDAWRTGGDVARAAEVLYLAWTEPK